MNNTNQYLDLYGLHYYNEKLKKYVDDKEVKTDDVTISKNASGELEVTGHLKRLIDNVYVPRPQEIAIITGVKITGDSNNITITGGTLELPEGSVNTEYLQVGDTSTNRYTFISSEGISFIPTGMHSDNINTYIRDNSIESFDIVAKKSLRVEDDFLDTPAVYITPQDITFLRNDTGSINNIKSINMSSGSINGLTNINTVSGTITNLDSIHFHSGGTFISGVSIKVNSEGTLDTPPLEVYNCININKAGGYGGSQSVITNNEIITFHGTYYKEIEVGDHIGSTLIVQPERINFYSSTLGGTLKNVHAINMNSGLISGISDIYSNTGEINLHGGNINMYNGKISGVQDIGFYHYTGIEISQSGIKGSLNSGIQINGVITGGNFSNLVLDDHITYSGSNNIFTQEYIDQLKNALGIN